MPNNFITSNKKIDNDVQEITNYLLDNIDHVDAIILVGSFGRGEGSILHHDNEIYAINDYDLVVISNKNYSEVYINNLRRELEKKLSIRQVDLTFYKKTELRKTNFSMYIYDLKYASKIIYGDSNILELIPNMDSKKMPILEGIRPLFLFGISLLQAYPYQKDITDFDIFWSYQQISKSVIGWSTALLVSKGLYDPSYKKRQEIFLKKFSDDLELCRYVNLAYEFKLNPSFNPINTLDLKKYWNKITKAHLQVCKQVIGKYYSSKSNSLESVCMSYKKSFRNRLKILYTIFFGIDKRTIINLDVGQLFLCKAISSENNSTKDYYFNLARIEAENVSKYLKTPFNLALTNIELINFFIDSNPNSSSWNNKGNKLRY